MTQFIRFSVLGFGIAAAFSWPVPGRAQSAAAPPGPTILQQVAHFDHQVTGVAVAQDGRIFVNFPRWTEDNAISVAEIKKDGGLTPYPNAEWNSWRNAKADKISPADHFVCVQSVVIDPQNHLWVVDPAAPATEKIVKGGPKLVEINLASNKVMRVISFDENIAPVGSYLNDIRFSPDGKYGYLTDSGKGALITVNLETAQAKRVLDGDPRTQVEKGVQIIIDGKPLRKPDGQAPQFASDGIAVSPDGQWVYWQALTGKTLYRVPAASLNNFTTPASTLSDQVQVVGKGEPADGFWMDRAGALYYGSMQDNAVKVRIGDKVSTVVKDARLRWPDSFAQGADGTLYITSSHIQDSGMFKPQNGPQTATELWKIVSDGNTARTAP